MLREYYYYIKDKKDYKLRGGAYMFGWAYLPKIVNTWRGSRALIWMQRYYIDAGDSVFFALNGGGEKKGDKHCLKLGFFSIEL